MMPGGIAGAVIVGNWKCNGSNLKLRRWADEFDPAGAQVVLCVPHPYITEAVRQLAGRAEVGCQDVSAAHGGAHTGQTSAAMAADCGCGYTIVGHSECRAAGQTDAQVAARLERAAQAGLRPILCVGETLAQREAGRAEQTVKKQLGAVASVLAGCPATLIAYEPVWAIGTGRNATAQDAQKMAKMVRRTVSKLPEGSKIAVLYGGSANSGNAAEFLAQEAIGGLLVGGASLDAGEFSTVCALSVRSLPLQ